MYVLDYSIFSFEYTVLVRNILFIIHTYFIHMVVYIVL